MWSSCLPPTNNLEALQGTQCTSQMEISVWWERRLLSLPRVPSFLLLSPSVCRGGLHPLCGPETERFESESEEEGKERAFRINTHTSTGGKTWCERRCKPYGTIKPYTSHLVQQAVGVRTQVCSLPRVLLNTLMHGCLTNHRSSPHPPGLSRTEPLSFRTCLA